MATYDTRLSEMLNNITPGSWHERGLCARPGFDGALFLPENIQGLRPICQDCPVRLECAVQALLGDEDENRAGLTPEELKAKYAGPRRTALLKEVWKRQVPPTTDQTRPDRSLRPKPLLPVGRADNLTPTPPKKKGQEDLEERYRQEGRALLQHIAALATGSPPTYPTAQQLVRVIGFRHKSLTTLRARQMEEWGWLTRVPVKGGHHKSRHLVITELGFRELRQQNMPSLAKETD